MAATFLLATRFLWAQESSEASPAAQQQPVVTDDVAAVASKFSYQGLLEEGGSVVTGTRDMTFRLHRNAGCTDPVGAAVSLADVSVEDGLFNVEVPVDHADINGQARWLQVQVDGSAIGCQELLAAPYALTLRPGAIISGSVGIRVLSSEESGAAIEGHALTTSGTPTGIRGETYAIGGYGGYFTNNTSSALGPDVVLGGNAANDEGNLWSDPAESSSDLYLRSNDEIWLDLDQNNDEDSEFRVRNGTNTIVFSVNESGNTYAPGTKSAIVETALEEYNLVYAVESPVVVIEDFGSARVEEGATTVEIDPLFAKTVNLELDYQVFLTPVDGWAPLYVTNKTPTSFEVLDAEGQASIAFDYRIVARRVGYEEVRLESVASPMIASPSSNDEADD